MSFLHDSSTPPWRGTRSGSASSTLRIGDAERNEVANALARHFGDGRLDQAELDDRLARAAAAKTRADLAPLLADLPPLDAPPGAPATCAARRPRRGLGWLVALVLAVIALSAVAHAAVALVWPRPAALVVVAVVVFVLLRRRGRR